MRRQADAQETAKAPPRRDPAERLRRDLERVERGTRTARARGHAAAQSTIPGAPWPGAATERRHELAMRAGGRRVAWPGWSASSCGALSPSPGAGRRPPAVIRNHTCRVLGPPGPSPSHLTGDLRSPARRRSFTLFNSAAPQPRSSRHRGPRKFVADHEPAGTPMPIEDRRPHRLAAARPRRSA